MIAGDVNKLADLIRQPTIPKWLYDYLNEHRNEMIFDLKVFGVCYVPMPDGRQMVIRAKV